jgi:hypothetical protein
MDFLPSLLSSFVEAGFALTPAAAAASLAGFGAALPVQKLFQKRLEAARDVLLDELRHGQAPQGYVADGDEAVAIVYRYQRAAMEGTARLNLRLLAQAMRGQLVRAALSADEFLHHADMLSSLRRPEIVVLGTALRVDAKTGPSDNRVGALSEGLKVALIGQPMFPDQEALESYCFSVLRYGLLHEGIDGERAAWGGFPVIPTRILKDVAALIDIDAALAAEH